MIQDKRVLGIDYGSERVGTAVASEDASIAFPLDVYVNDDTLLEKITALMQTERAEKVVIGNSLNFQGEENPIMSRAKAFGEALKEKTGCAVVYEDETLTSAQARRQFEEKEKTRKPHDEVVDASAAALILQSYLDKKYGQNFNR